MNFTDKKASPLLPTPLLSGSHMFARLPLPPLLTLSHHLHTFASPHSLPLFAFLFLPTASSHICIRLLSIYFFSLPLIAYILSPLFSPAPSMLTSSLSHSPNPPIFMQSLIPLLTPSHYVCPLPPTTYVSSPSPPHPLPTSVHSALLCIRCLLACRI